MTRFALAAVPAILIACTALTLSGMNSARPVYADCSCVDYIVNKFGIPGGCGCAMNQGACLQTGGYVQVPNPAQDEVVIFSPLIPAWTKLAAISA